MKKNDELESFLRSKAATAPEAEPEVDWEARKNKWLDETEKLYGLVWKWLEPLAREGTIRCSREPMTVEEDNIGSYRVDVLTLSIGKQRVEFRPKGTQFEGVDGLVDVSGQRAVRTLVLKRGQWFVVEKAMLLKTFPFNKDSFRDLLQDVMV